jgi:hypothetical protein
MPWPKDNNASMFKKVHQGKRMDMPKGCPKDMWKVLMDTWQGNEHKRPNFEQLKAALLHCTTPSVPLRDLGLIATQSTQERGRRKSEFDNEDEEEEEDVADDLTGEDAYAIAQGANDLYGYGDRVLVAGGSGWIHVYCWLRVRVRVRVRFTSIAA